MLKHLNFDAVIADRRQLAITKWTIAWHKMSGRLYSKPGDWMATVSDADFSHLMGLVDDTRINPDGDAARQLMTLAMVLATLEGVDVTESVMQKQATTLISMLAVELLSKQGIMTLKYDEITFDDVDNNVPFELNQPTQ